MAYLKNVNNKIIADAILTNYGKQRLAVTGELGISKFFVSDDEVDYSLYNVLNDFGSDYYDSAIINMPVLQASSDNSISLKYPLFTKTDVAGADAITVLRSSYDTAKLARVSTYDEIPITPNFSPALASNIDKNKIFYVAEIKATSATKWGVSVDLRGIVDSSIGRTAEMQEIEELLTVQGMGGNSSKFAVGHSFTFKVNRFAKAGHDVNYRLVIYAYNIAVAPEIIDFAVRSSDSVVTLPEGSLTQGQPS